MYTGTATRASPAATAKAIESARRFVPSTRRTSGRAIRIRRTKIPIAIISVKSASHFVITSEVDVAEPDMCGILNCGAGPGLGPTAKVKAPCTGWPSTEIARQYTRYQPSESRFTGTTSVFGSDGERSTGPVVSEFALTSETETTAKRGSTASSKVSWTFGGGVFTVTLAAGTVRTRYECADAAA